MYLINLFLESGLETSEKLAKTSSFPIVFWKGTEQLLATLFLYSEYSAKTAPNHVALDLMEGEEMNSSSSLKFTIFSMKNTDRYNKCLSRETEKRTSTSWILIVIKNIEGTKLTKAVNAISGQAQKCQYTEKHMHFGGWKRLPFLYPLSLFFYSLFCSSLFL